MEKKDKLQITLDKELKPLLDAEMEKTNRTKSALINYILNKYFRTKHE